MIEKLNEFGWMETEALKRSMSTKYVTSEADGFTVHHFAGSVNYKVKDFFVKNHDYVNIELIEVMRESADPHMVAIFSNKKTKTGHVITTDTGPPPKKYEKVKSKVCCLFPVAIIISVVLLRLIARIDG